MLVSDLISDVYRNTGHASSPGSTVETRVLAYINQAYKEILRDRRWGWAMRRDITTFASVASDPFVTLPTTVARVISITDRTNQMLLGERTLSWLREVNPSLNMVVANPWAWIQFPITSTGAIKLQLWPTPSAIVTYHLDYEIKISDLTTADTPQRLPEDFHHMLALKATIKEWSKRDKAGVEILKQYMVELRRAERELTSFLRVSANDDGPYRHSTFGPWYPAGT